MIIYEKQKIGRILPIPKGEYDPEKTYMEKDIVYYKGSSYAVKADNTKGIAPDDENNSNLFLKISERGLDGKDGPDGPVGPPMTINGVGPVNGDIPLTLDNVLDGEIRKLPTLGTHLLFSGKISQGETSVTFDKSLENFTTFAISIDRTDYDNHCNQIYFNTTKNALATFTGDVNKSIEYFGTNTHGCSECDSTCIGTCSSACASSCESTCLSSSDGSCGDTCTSGCITSCTSSCGNNCSSACLMNCSSQCINCSGTSTATSYKLGVKNLTNTGVTLTPGFPQSFSNVSIYGIK